MAPQFRRDRHDVVPVEDGPLPRLGVLGPGTGQGRLEPLPGFRRTVLATELPLAVAPSPGGDHRCDALVDGTGVEGHCRAEAGPDKTDAFGIDLGLLGKKAERRHRVGDLLQADQPAAFAFAFAAAAHVEPERRVAELAEHLDRLEDIARVLRASEAVQDDHCRKGTRRCRIRQPEDARQGETVGIESNSAFHHVAPVGDGYATLS